MPRESTERAISREATFSLWFWRSGLAVWFALGIAFGLFRRWDYFALSVLWVLASVAGWSRSEKQLHL